MFILNLNFLFNIFYFILFFSLLSFCCQSNVGEKVTLGISILLSLVVFLLLVSKILPPTSLVLPLIAKYLLFTFIMNCISILVTVIIINYNFRGPRTHTMPTWTRIIFLHYLPIVLFLRRPKRTRLQWMRDMPSLSGSNAQANQQTDSQTKSGVKRENSKECQSNQSNSQTLEKKNSVKRKDVQLTKQASTSSQHTQILDQPQTTIPHTLESPKQPLQQLNVTTLPLAGNLIQQQPFQMHNHFHTLASHHHFHHPPLLMQTHHPAFHHHTACTLTPQSEQLQHHLNASQPTIAGLHHTHYGSQARLMRSLDNSNLINPNFDPLNHLLNNADLAAEHLSALPAAAAHHHHCLPSESNLDEDDQNENLNHLNLRHPSLGNHLDFGLQRGENTNNELNLDQCTLPSSLRPIGQSVCTDDLSNMTDLAHKPINQRQANSDSNSTSSFYLSPAAYKATEAIEFISEHLRNEDEYIQVKYQIYFLLFLFLFLFSLFFERKEEQQQQKKAK